MRQTRDPFEAIRAMHSRTLWAIIGGVPTPVEGLFARPDGASVAVPGIGVLDLRREDRLMVEDELEMERRLRG